MSDSSTRFLATELGPRLERLRSSLNPSLAELLDRLLNRHGWTGDWGRLLNPLGQPVVQLPYWMDEIASAGIATSVLDDLAEAAVIGYLHVRVQDDLIDEGGWPVQEGLLLSEALLIRHVSMLARHAGSSDQFWTYFDAKGWDYCDASLLERSLLDPGSAYDEAGFDLVMRRSAALAIPSAVVLDLADRWDLLAGLEDLVWHVVRSGQLVDDLIDAADDLDRGNHTWVVRRLGGSAGREALLHKMGIGGGFDEIIGDINRDLGAADDAAARLGAHAVVSWLEARRAAVVRLQESFFARLFTGFNQASVDTAQ
ncbi:MAG TPA: hypothetical protein VM848_14920 [Acidimicrobiia bacterium]|nr:hypothetical protein [Acidimicrobiia bacterium]